MKCNIIGSLLVLSLFTLGCSRSTKVQNSPTPKNETEKSELRANVIYGEDNRHDLYDVADKNWLAVADSTVALVRKTKMQSRTDGTVSLNTTSYADSYRLCSDEPFYTQRTLAFCSGFLVAPDVVVTAGHCMRQESDCGNTSFVFGFNIAQVEGSTPDRAPASEVYDCQRIIHSEMTSSGIDYSVVKLTRPVENHSPLVVRSTGEIQVGHGLVVIGHPAGLPTKFTDGANVRSVRPEYLVANLDTYGGNSGSAVFNAETLEVEGILVRGEMDYRYRGECRVSNVCDSSGCRGEDVTRIHHILPYIGD